MSTILRQERHVEYIGPAKQKFVITSSLAWDDLDDFPHPFVFVFTIVDRNDPKADTFSRIATLADFTTLPQGRDDGLASAPGLGIEFLDTSVVVSYTDLATAVAAEQAFKDRLSQLVSDWQTYQNSFVAHPTAETISLPLVSLTTKAALLAAYKTAKQNRYALQVALDAATADFTVAQDKFNELSDDVTNLQTIVNTFFLVAAPGYATTVTDLTQMQIAASTYAAAVSGSHAGPDAAIASAIATAQAAEIANGQKSAAATTAASSANSYLGVKTAALSIATGDLHDKTSAKVAAQQALTDAVAAESTARTALLIVCPTFDTTTICNVAG